MIVSVEVAVRVMDVPPRKLPINGMVISKCGSVNVTDTVCPRQAWAGVAERHGVPSIRMSTVYASGSDTLLRARSAICRQ